MKNLFLLGDSIRMQYQPVVAEKLKDLAEISGPHDNGRWSGYTLNSLRFWLPHLPRAAPDHGQARSPHHHRHQHPDKTERSKGR